MEILTINIAAGETKPYALGGNYMEIVDSMGAVDIVLIGDAGQNDSMRGALAGSYIKQVYTSFMITSQIAQTLHLLVSNREGGTRRLSGSVVVTNVQGAYTQAAVAVSSAAGGTQVSAANPTRRGGELFNVDPSATMYVTIDGSVPTAANGIPVGPGQSYPLPEFCPTGAINALSTVANGKAIWIEG